MQYPVIHEPCPLIYVATSTHQALHTRHDSRRWGYRDALRVPHECRYQSNDAYGEEQDAIADCPRDCGVLRHGIPAGGSQKGPERARVTML